MKRVTITMPDDTRRRVQRAAEREGKSFSAKATELIEERLAAQSHASPFEAIIGIASKKLPYTAADIDQELERTYADAIRKDSGLERGGER